MNFPRGGISRGKFSRMKLPEGNFYGNVFLEPVTVGVYTLCEPTKTLRFVLEN